MIPFQKGRGVIATNSGYFDLENPRAEDVHLADIVGALVRIYRFSGHGNGVVSVARHSVNCYFEARARKLPEDMCRLALMHDAAEAYVGDMARPLKLLLPEFSRIEARVWKVICERFGLSVCLPPDIKEIDNLALITEAKALFPNHERWPGWPEPGFSFSPNSPIASENFPPDHEAIAFLNCAAAAGIR